MGKYSHIDIIEDDCGNCNNSTQVMNDEDVITISHWDTRNLTLHPGEEYSKCEKCLEILKKMDRF